MLTLDKNKNEENTTTPGVRRETVMEDRSEFAAQLETIEKYAKKDLSG